MSWYLSIRSFSIIFAPDFSWAFMTFSRPECFPPVGICIFIGGRLILSTSAVVEIHGRVRGGIGGVVTPGDFVHQTPRWPDMGVEVVGITVWSNF